MTQSELGRLIHRLAVLVLLAGCGGGGVSVAPIRLLDPSEAAVVEWSDAAGERPSDGLTRVGVDARWASDGRVARVLMHGDEAHGTPKRRPRGHEQRLALLAPSGTTYRFPLRVPRDAVLEVGLGYVPPGEETESSILFEVFVEVGDGPRGEGYRALERAPGGSPRRRVARRAGVSRRLGR